MQSDTASIQVFYFDMQLPFKRSEVTHSVCMWQSEPRCGDAPCPQAPREADPDPHAASEPRWSDPLPLFLVNRISLVVFI